MGVSTKIIDEVVQNDKAVLRMAQYPIEEDERFTLVGRGQITNEKNCMKILKMAKSEKCEQLFPIRSSCGNIQCPLCFQSTLLRKTSKILNRLIAFQEMSKYSVLYHWTFSLPVKMTYEKGLKKMKKLFKDFDASGVIMHHSHRLQDDFGNSHDSEQFESKEGKWVKGQHFHVITDLNFFNTTLFEEKTKVVAKRISKLRTVESLFRLVYYEVSHISYDKKRFKIQKEVDENGNIVEKKIEQRQVLTRCFGKMSNNKFNTFTKSFEIEMKVTCNCEKCREKRYKESREYLKLYEVLVKNSKIKKDRYGKVEILERTDKFVIGEFIEYWTRKETIYIPNKLFREPDKLKRYLKLNGWYRGMIEMGYLEKKQDRLLLEYQHWTLREDFGKPVMVNPENQIK